MSKSHNLSSSTIKHLAARITEKLGSHAASFINEGGRIEIGETLEVWFLGRSTITKTNSRIVSIAIRTGYWHHQIRFGGKGTEFARSRPHGPDYEDWVVHAVIRSRLPAKIDEGIAQIDADASLENSFARLLLIPAYHTTTIWMTMNDDTDRILVVDSPSSFEKLKPGHVYSGAEFLKTIGKERHSQGLPRRPSQGPSRPAIP